MSGGVDLDQAQVLLGGEALEGFGGEGRGDDGFDEELGDLFGGGGVDLAVDADDAAEGGDGVGGEGAAGRPRGRWRRWRRRRGWCA